jgi:hypothetical protein
MKSLLKIFPAFLGVLLVSCKHGYNTVFTEVSPSYSNVSFRNDITETKDQNILTYEYLYNGGGVAVGDLNNDGLPDIFFTGNMTPNKLYLNKGDLKFEDVTDKAGVAGRNKWKTGVVMADVNGDGLLDIYVCYSGPGDSLDRSNELYINNGVKNGMPSFTESAKAYGLDATGTYTTSVVFFDMDNDGDLDMLMVNHADVFFNPFFNTEKLRATRNAKFGNRLYRNDNGHFTDISVQSHIDGSGLNFSLSASVSDINGDGWPDIYVTNDYDERDFLYLNNHDGTFREVLPKAAKHISEFAMGSDIADFNNDNKPDVMELDMLPEDNHRQKLLRGADNYDKFQLLLDHGFHKQLMRNSLQLNNGNDEDGTPVLSEIGQLAGVSNTDWSWAPLFADFDNDGWKDLFVTNGILKDMTNLDFVKYTSGYSPQYVKEKQDKGEIWELVQKMPTTKLTNYLFKNNRDLTFSNVTASWGFTKQAVSNGAVYADLDNDGDLDLVINQLNDVATIYRNNTSEKSHSAHYLRIRLKGSNKNSSGIGAKVSIKTEHGEQFQEQYFNKGFQSSVDPVIHVGLGKDSVVQSVRVLWPTGEVSILDNVKADCLLVVEQKNASIPQNSSPAHNESIKPLFKDVTNSAGINFVDKPSSYVDFKISPLLPYQVSKMGPCIAKADVNGDGLEDVFIGAGIDQASKLYLQTRDGHFILSPSQPWNTNKKIFNADALFFDADGDGDMDLYLAGGGAEYPQGSENYQDRIFENDGKGNFKEILNALPKETISASCARVADINHDGKPDLFIGGRFQPGMFPMAPPSNILKNVSQPGKIQFEIDRSQKDATLAEPGMVTDAVWCDLNKDGWQDLVVVGQFMPITVFENHKGVLVNKTNKYGLSGTNGWWSRVNATDLDGDGNIDLIVGNIGLNTQLKASQAEPVTITCSDFNNDGTMFPILSYFIQGKSYPYNTRDELMDQMPWLQKKFARYIDYADAQLSDLFPQGKLDSAKVFKINLLSSVILKNTGRGRMDVKALPKAAQASMVNGIVVDDLQKDGHKDILLAGNFYPFRVQFGPLDAGVGMVLRRNGKGDISSFGFAETGLKIDGDVRNLIKVNGGNGNYWLVAAKSDGALQVLKRNN